MENLNILPSLLGGALIGVSVSILLLFNGRMAGISGIMNGIFKSPKDEKHWRLTFLIGLVIGAIIFQIIIPDFFIPRENYPLWLIAIGGFLVGIGTRLSSGCTSGHGICGIANLSKRSIFATLTFMASGMLTVFIIKHLAELA